MLWLRRCDKSKVLTFMHCIAKTSTDQCHDHALQQIRHLHGLGKHAMQDEVAMGNFVATAFRIFEPSRSAYLTSSLSASLWRSHAFRCKQHKAPLSTSELLWRVGYTEHHISSA